MSVQAILAESLTGGAAPRPLTTNTARNLGPDEVLKISKSNQMQLRSGPNVCKVTPDKIG
jgi:hypothetical protein